MLRQEIRNLVDEPIEIHGLATAQTKTPKLAFWRLDKVGLVITYTGFVALWGSFAKSLDCSTQ
jgi:hypothetical protein